MLKKKEYKRRLVNTNKYKLVPTYYYLLLHIIEGHELFSDLLILYVKQHLFLVL